MFNLMQKAQSVLSNYDPSSDPNAGLPDGDYQAIITDVLVDVREGDNEKPIYRDGVDSYTHPTLPTTHPVYTTVVAASFSI